MTALPIETWSPEPLPLVDCQPWCELANGHPDCHHLSDQLCYGTEHSLELSQHVISCPDSSRACSARRRGEGCPGHREDLAVYAEQEPRGALTYCLSRSGGPAIRLTAHELVQLVANLAAVQQETQ